MWSMTAPRPERELDVIRARERLEAAAEEAKRLEDEGVGFAAGEAWERYELIKKAIAAQERSERVARRPRASAG
jgi:hypothetical protein